jgi:hypothetical protein
MCECAVLDPLQQAAHTTGDYESLLGDQYPVDETNSIIIKDSRDKIMSGAIIGYRERTYIRQL